jgi:hypothetical protein
MRDMGYSLETAVADLVDNSITAKATRIDIICDASLEEPCLAILDNGSGMTPAELLLAMRHGTERRDREAGDLGRFGLGLKTASFSQCRLLTVLTRRGGVTSAAEWDLDHIDREDDWLLAVLEEDEMATLPYAERLGRSGTLVLWRKPDRLLDNSAREHWQGTISAKLDTLGRHLSLVFHRYLAGPVPGHKKKISITVNGGPVEPFDPFCTTNKATQVLPEESAHVGDVVVKLQPYVLPHHSHLTAKEHDFYQDRSDFLANQGAYIYRNSRLMAWGDWFRLVPKGEANKLARVQIDFPNSLDEAWTIDIKKSRAHPPREVKEALRKIIDQVADRSARVHRGRGQKLFSEIKAPLWERHASHEGIRYSVNMTHPLVEALRGVLPGPALKTLDLLLEAVTAALPVEAIYSDYATSPKEVAGSAMTAEQAAIRLRQLFEATDGVPKEAFQDIVRSTRLFAGHDDMVANFINEVFP